MRESTYRIVSRAEKRASQRSNQSYEMITHRAINERHWFKQNLNDEKITNFSM